MTRSGPLVISPLADDQSFSARAANLGRRSSPWYPSGTSLTQSSTPIQYAVVMGELEQIGPELFRVVIDRFGGGGCGRTIQAFNYGDARCQPAMTTAMLDVETVNGGASQNLEFLPITDVPLGSRSIPLKAAADSGGRRRADRAHIPHRGGIGRTAQLQRGRLMGWAS